MTYLHRFTLWIHLTRSIYTLTAHFLFIINLSNTHIHTCEIRSCSNYSLSSTSFSHTISPSLSLSLRVLYYINRMQYFFFKDPFNLYWILYRFVSNICIHRLIGFTTRIFLMFSKSRIDFTVIQYFIKKNSGTLEVCTFQCFIWTSFGPPLIMWIIISDDNEFDKTL